MSSSSQEKQAKALEELMREFRQSTSLSTSIFRVMATRIGMAVTDMQVLDLLDLIGPSTPGQLAELTGLTTGAITKILDRLEKGEFVQRGRDKSDGRKVIVQLAAGKGEMQQVRSLLTSVGKAWKEVASRYDEGQISFLIEFLKESNQLAGQELLQLQQEMPSEEEEVFSAPLEGQKSGRLVVSCGISQLNLRVADLIDTLYQARFEGPVPKVSAKDGAVTIRYPRRLLGLGEKQGRAMVVLNTSIPWRISIQGGAAEIEALLDGLDLAMLEITGGFSLIRLVLPAPTGRVRIPISASASEIAFVRPAGVAIRIHLNGWLPELVLDDQSWNGVGPDARLQSPDFSPTAPCYDIELTGYANKVTITSN